MKTQITTFKDLKGKTITKIAQMKLKDFDDKGFLRLDFTDNSFAIVEGSYREYSRNAEDEYVTDIYLSERTPNQLIKLPAERR